MEYNDAMNHVIPTGEFRGQTIREAVRSERGLRNVDQLAQGALEAHPESQAACERVLRDGGVHRDLMGSLERKVDGKDYA